MSNGYIFIGKERHAITLGEPFSLHLPQYNIIIRDALLGNGLALWSNVNIYEAEIGDETRIAAFVEIRGKVKVGRKVKIEPFVFIPEGVAIEDGVFIGPGVTFTNDKYPRAWDSAENPVQEYKVVPTVVKRGASIGAGAVIRCGITIGEGAMVGAGAVVVDDVPARAVVYGQKARVSRYLP